MDNQHTIGSIVSSVDQILEQAIINGASDIHLEPSQESLRIRYRLDGVLYDQEPIKSAQGIQIIARIKVLAHLDLAQRRIPQDGKFTLAIDKRMIDLRVSTFPTLFGEKIVIRILDSLHNNFTLTSLGLSPLMRSQLTTLLERSHGFVLVTGPTGSGKTTTLYASLSHIHSPEKNIITLEDPIEYSLEGVTQGQIQKDTGFSFAQGIRALLRQDPDIAMIGEIRDQESAHIAIEAALTGHLVLSTLHTNDAASALIRLMDMGIEPFLINASISGIMAQRLARMLCQDCLIEYIPTPDDHALMNKHNIHLDTLFTAPGCSSCSNRGYKGRIGIFELLTITDDLRQLMVNNPRVDHIRTQASAEGSITLISDGMAKVAGGIISLQEMVRSIM